MAKDSFDVTAIHRSNNECCCFSWIEAQSGALGSTEQPVKLLSNAARFPTSMGLTGNNIVLSPHYLLGDHSNPPGESSELRHFYRKLTLNLPSWRTTTSKSPNSIYKPPIDHPPRNPASTSLYPLPLPDLMFFGDENTFDPLSDLLDLRGKVAVVTGGNRGNGYATVKHLARAGAKVYLGARNSTKAKEAIEHLRWEGLSPGHGQVVWLELDLSSPKAARRAAEEVIRLERRLDILVNNAGISSGKFRGSDSALSSIATINYISPFVFTRALLPLLAFTAMNDFHSDVRIVNVVAASHRVIPFPSLKFKSIEDLNGKNFPSEYLRFSHSKLLCLLWTEHLQHIIETAHPLGPLPITAISVDPGVVETQEQVKSAVRPSKITGLYSALSKHLSNWTGVSSLVVPEHERGCSTAFAAASEAIWSERRRYKGAYLEPCPNAQCPKITSTGMFARDGERDREMEKGLAGDLWSLTERILAESGVV
ncbi:hypothetical protein PQX77_007709 [Marasmius sp. AFHP31]|nr:hypothetical protein PQX77_007709 [Marasmius sp. AFHP31]